MRFARLVAASYPLDIVGLQRFFQARATKNIDKIVTRSRGRRGIAPVSAGDGRSAQVERLNEPCAQANVDVKRSVRRGAA
jgi:hypothetical protein